MPELPEVENFRRTFERAALRKTVADAGVTDARILHGLSTAALRKAVKGRRFGETRRHGKHLFAHLDGGPWLTFHFGMTGGFAAFGGEEDPPRFTRLRFDFSEGGHLAFTDQRLFGEIGLTDDVDGFLRAHGLGPDALDPALDAGAFAEMLTRRKRGLKAALMDQSLIAGIGNEYSDEILFQARLHPETPTDSLDREALTRLFRAMRKVLKTAIDKSAGSDGYYERLPADFLLPHRDKGGKCPVCGGPLQSGKAAGRTARWCPRCQPAPTSAAA